LNWLYAHDKVKSLVNIAHGEGFGLPMFEAAQAALPIVTIGWSGQMDFLKHKGKEYFSKVKHELKQVQADAVWEGVLRSDSKWAYADQGSYKMKLRDMKKNWAKHKAKAVDLQKIINDNFTEERIYEQFCSPLSPFLEPTTEDDFTIE